MYISPSRGGTDTGGGSEGRREEWGKRPRVRCAEAESNRGLPARLDEGLLSSTRRVSTHFGMLFGKKTARTYTWTRDWYLEIAPWNRQGTTSWKNIGSLFDQFEVAWTRSIANWLMTTSSDV